MPMGLVTISAESAICFGCVISSTLSAPDRPSRRRARRATMQLNLDLFDEPDPPPTPAATWEQIDEAARLAAIETLARLIARMLQDGPATEPNNE
jgi:hypothetical protein